MASKTMTWSPHQARERHDEARHVYEQKCDEAVVVVEKAEAPMACEDGDHACGVLDDHRC